MRFIRNVYLAARATMRRRSSFPCLFVLSISALLVLAARPLSAAKKKPPLHPLNLNTAAAAELQQVPGIGPSSAAKVLKTRKPNGLFKCARSPRHQRHRPQLDGKNAQVFDGRKSARAKASAERASE
jgi:Helix-hairpin-helix motif